MYEFWLILSITYLNNFRIVHTHKQSRNQVPRFRKTSQLISFLLVNHTIFLWAEEQEGLPNWLYVEILKKSIFYKTHAQKKRAHVLPSTDRWELLWFVLHSSMHVRAFNLLISQTSLTLAIFILRSMMPNKFAFQELIISQWI